MIVFSFWDFALFTDLAVFLLMMVIIMGLLGASSGYISVGLMSAFMTFVYAAQYANLTLYTNTLYIVLVLITIGMGMKIWGYATGETTT